MAGPNHNVIKRLMAASEGGRWDALPGEVLDAIGRALADRPDGLDDFVAFSTLHAEMALALCCSASASRCRR